MYVLIIDYAFDRQGEKLSKKVETLLHMVLMMIHVQVINLHFECNYLDFSMMILQKI